MNTRTLGGTQGTKKALPKVLGFTLYEGPSVLNGEPIAAILTLSTSNRKTGDMAQIWIIGASDLNPVQLSQAKLDSSICGNCPHKQSIGGACYVNIGQAPTSVYKAYKRGRYAPFDASLHADYLKGRKVRLGAYGDPAAVPFDVLEAITQLTIGHTGYTHQAKHKNFDPRHLRLSMVSVDTPAQAKAWHKVGVRTFRVALQGDQLFDNETECLADSKGLSCAECLLCDGQRGNVAITVHGSRAKNFKSKLIATSGV